MRIGKIHIRHLAHPLLVRLYWIFLSLWVQQAPYIPLVISSSCKLGLLGEGIFFPDIEIVTMGFSLLSTRGPGIILGLDCDILVPMMVLSASSNIDLSQLFLEVSWMVGCDENKSGPRRFEDPALGNSVVSLGNMCDFFPHFLEGLGICDKDRKLMDSCWSWGRKEAIEMRKRANIFS